MRSWCYLCEKYIKITNAHRKTSLMGYRGWGGVRERECCGIVEENGGWRRVRGVIEISIRMRTILNSKFQMSLVRNELLKFLNIISKLF